MSKTGIFSIELFTPTAKFIAREGALSDHKFFCLYKNIPSEDFQGLKIHEYRPHLMQRFISYLFRIVDLKWFYGSRKSGALMLDRMAAEGIETVICHFGPSGTELYRYLGTRDLKIIVVFHGYDISKLLRYRSYRKELKRIGADNRVHARVVADYLVNDLKAYFPAERIHTIKNGVELKFPDEMVKPSGVKVDEYIYFQGANLVEKKGHRYVLKAFSMLPEDIIKSSLVMFAGSGVLKDDLVKYAKALGILDRVRFLGHLSGSDYETKLRNSNCFIHHSITDQNNETETIPTAIIEAMSESKLVLSTRHAGIPELIEHGRTGLLVEEKDVAKLSEYMLWCQLNEKDAFTLSRNAQEFVIKEFSLQKMLQEYEELLKKISNEEFQ